MAISADEFFRAIAGDPVEHDIMVAGKKLFTVKVRGLTVRERNTLRQYTSDDYELTVRIAHTGLVEPKMTEEMLERLRDSNNGAIVSIADKILALSAEGDTTELEGKAGGGS